MGNLCSVNEQKTLFIYACWSVAVFFFFFFFFCLSCIPSIMAALLFVFHSSCMLHSFLLNLKVVV